MDKTRHHEAASRYAARGQLERAAREYQRILEADGKDVRALQKLAEIHQKSGRNADAARLLKQLAESYSDQGFYLKAVAVYKQVLKLGDDQVEVNLQLAQLYRQLGLISDATQQYQLAANHYDKQGKVKESLEILRSMVELDPENVAGKVKLGELYAREQMPEEAAAELKRAAAQLERMGRNEDRLRVLERIIQIVPKDAAASRELAQQYLSQREPKKALARLQVCFTQNPREIETLQLLARAFADLGQAGRTVSVYRELAQIQQEMGQTEAQRQTLGKILELVPGDAEATEALAALDGQENQGEVPASLEPAPQAQEKIEPRREATASPRVALIPPAPPAPQTAAPSAQPAATSSKSSPPSPSAAPSTPAAVTPPAPKSATGTPHAWPKLPPLPEGKLSQTTPPEVLRKLTEAEVFLKYGLSAKAIEHLTQLLKSHPHHIAVLERVLSVAQEQGDESQSLLILARLVELASRSQDFEKESTFIQMLAQKAPAHPLVTAAAQAAALLEHEVSRPILTTSFELEPEDSPAPVALLEDAPEDLLIDPEFTVGPDERSIALEEADFLGQGAGFVGGSDSHPDPETETGDFIAEGDLEALPDTDTASQPQPAALIPPPKAPAGHHPPSAPEHHSYSTVPPQSFERSASWAPNHEQSQGGRSPKGVSVWDWVGEGGAVGDDDAFNAPSESEAATQDNASKRQALGAPHAHSPFDRPSPDPARARSSDHPLADPLDDSLDDSLDDELSAQFSELRTDLGESGWSHALEPETESEGGSGVESQAAPGIQPETTGTPGSGFSSFPETSADSAPHASHQPAALERELAEARLLLAQGMNEDASRVLEWILSHHPEHPEALSLAQSLDASTQQGFDDWTENLEVPEEHAESSAESGIRDIGQELAQELASELGLDSSLNLTPAPEPVTPVSVGDVLSEVRQRIHAEISEADSQTHYDLGIAYREMGLYEEAIQEFQTALQARGNPRVIDCLTMMGVCLLDLERPQDALEVLGQTLKTPGLTLEASKEAHYHIGRSHQLLGNLRKALDHFTRVYRADREFRDVREKAAQLTRALRSETVSKAQGEQSPGTSTGSQRKIGYI